MVSFILLLTSALTLANPPSEEDIECLTKNIYWESRGEPVLGQVWVAQSVLTRRDDPRWEDTICKVIYEPYQYSWTQEPTRPMKDASALKLAREVAIAALEGRIDVPKLNHYLRCDWMPKQNTWWWKSMEFIGQQGAHCYFNDTLNRTLIGRK